MKNYCQSLSSSTAIVLLSWLFFTPIKVLADRQIQPFTANYRADYYGIAINAARTLETHDDNTIISSFRTESFFVDIKESSTLTWQLEPTSSLIPMGYQYQRTGIGKNRHVQLTFDWQAQRIIDTRTKAEIPIPANATVFDKLSYQLQLQYDLINGATEFDYLVVDNRQLKNYRFRIIGEETVVTELGKLETIRLERVRDNDKRTTFIWFAKDWNYLLVQLEQREKDGNKYRIQLVSAVVNDVNVVGQLAENSHE